MKVEIWTLGQKFRVFAAPSIGFQKYLPIYRRAEMNSVPSKSTNWTTFSAALAVAGWERIYEAVPITDARARIQGWREAARKAKFHLLMSVNTDTSEVIA